MVSRTSASSLPNRVGDLAPLSDRLRIHRADQANDIFETERARASAADSRYWIRASLPSRRRLDTDRALLDFAKTIRTDLADWRPRDMIDIQSFIWITGSSEYD